MKKVLFIGNGAREHCMVENLARDCEVFVFANAKNPGIMKLSKDYIVARQDDFETLKKFVIKNMPDFAVIGPEAPLSMGVVDFLETRGVKSFGPLKELAKLETSKSWTRGLMVKYDIPGMPKFRNFKDINGVREFIRQLEANCGGFVVKPDGLTGGKGVKVSGEHMNTVDEGVAYCEEVLKEHPSVVIEEKFVGEEFSLMGITDGVSVVECQPVQDHKRAFNGDTGPNTGGMGSYSTGKLLPFMKDADIKQAHEITVKMAKAMYQETGKKYVGVMYGGFIITKNGVKLIEYNARFGDPEAMNILPVMKTNFSKVCEAAIGGNLLKIEVEFEDVSTVCKYLVPKGYPDSSDGAGEVIDISQVNTKKVKLYFAGINEENGRLILSKSRSIGVVGVNKDVGIAENLAEEACNQIKGAVRHRSDIGKKELLDKRVRHMQALGRKF